MFTFESMYSFQQLLDITQREIARLDLPASPATLYDPIRYTMADGGKRVRPVALLMACNLFREDIAPAIPAALAVELFHNFTLLHDDIMDRAPMRRGKPAVYKKWNESTAILSGDVMQIYAYRLLTQNGGERLPEVLEIFNRVAIGVCEGQSLDMEFGIRDRVSVEEYLYMVEHKTAVLLAGALQIGAVLGGAPADVAEKLYHFGIDIGLAFQIQDDLLDTYSDAATLGKPIGGDILEGKKTYLLSSALQTADDARRGRLTALLHDGSAQPEEKIAAVRQIYDELSVRGMAEMAVKTYFDAADLLLGQLGMTEQQLVPLRELTRMLVGRRK